MLLLRSLTSLVTLSIGLCSFHSVVSATPVNGRPLQKVNLVPPLPSPSTENPLMPKLSILAHLDHSSIWAICIGRGCFQAQPSSRSSPTIESIIGPDEYQNRKKSKLWVIGTLKFSDHKSMEMIVDEMETLQIPDGPGRVDVRYINRAYSWLVNEKKVLVVTEESSRSWGSWSTSESSMKW
ncbi:uncharacterized protein C8R40DRAFT_96458 [Lentinula edodes]|uniref:uncharacterized protein n=1 Tax=Lentinula edodes TaxID=5353 RepID=UPI001E8CF9AB|nr:uncharacterized protein C8R40DRAFT_96458 [Lentinula edodes]KAH7877127.1 hypothetical protein C8R40DRAFT_96458 [Lentinula edodes]